MLSTDRFQVTSFGFSDVGLVRLRNEDFFAQLGDNCFYALADGMGGHRAGDVASREVVSHLCHTVIETRAFDTCGRESYEVSEALVGALMNANAHVYGMGMADEEYRGMGTTICCLLLKRGLAYFAHVGDSRIYRLRENVLEQLTTDHSLLNELLRSGKLEAGQVEDFPHKNVVTRAVGLKVHVEPEIDVAEVREGDLYLLCSDGLTDGAKEEDIESILRRAKDLEAAAKELIRLANRMGGVDNTTVVLVRVEGKDG